MTKLQSSGYLETAALPASHDPREREGTWSLEAWEFSIVFIGLYLAVERLSFIHPWAATGITPWNPQVALVFGVVLLRGLRAVPTVFLAMILSEALVRGTQTSLSAVFTCTAVGALGYILAGVVLSRQLSSRGRVRNLRDVAWMLGMGTVAPFLVGMGYVGAHVWFGLVELSLFPQVLLRYWIGDVVGVLALLPLVLVLMDRGSRKRVAAAIPRWETLLQFLTALSIFAVIYAFLAGQLVKYFFLLFLPLIWVAARQGLVGAAVALAFIQLGLIVLVKASDTGASTMLELQARMLGLSVTGLLLGVLVDERERAQERLRQSQRLAAAGEMAAALAHEVNQPLTALVTYGRACQHMLERSPEDIRQLSETVGKLTEQAQRVAAIVKRLRDFLRSGTMNLERVAPGEFLETLRASLLPQAQTERITINLNVAPDLPRIWVDRLELEIVVRNLLGNAIDSIRESHPSERTITLDATSQNGFVQISVIDSGPGILPEMRDKLFSPFSTSKSHGMGLGLAISRAIVTAHGGRLWAEPTAYGCFRLSLPTVTGDTDDIER